MCANLIALRSRRKKTDFICIAKLLIYTIKYAAAGLNFCAIIKPSNPIQSLSKIYAIDLVRILNDSIEDLLLWHAAYQFKNVVILLHFAV